VEVARQLGIQPEQRSVHRVVQRQRQ
jgi:hypothetical protein